MNTSMIKEVSTEELLTMAGIDRMIREKECRMLSGLSNTTRWELEKEGKFPKRIKIGVTAMGWRLSEIQAWIKDVSN
ncbi:helix-turn-helix transcriptional regulator [Rahnella sp. EDr1-12]|uniref:helix-turn-helix transcriptional regulator n=1 Tax=unclassified Rahnella TaxID=2635087 RepID=UPI003BAA092D